MIRSQSWLQPLVAAPDSGLALQNRRTRAILASVVEPAFDSDARRKGLLGRDHLAEGHAIVLAPCNSIHTFFMRFAIDVVFVSRLGEVLHVSANLRPWRIALAVRAHSVVEFRAGAVAASGTVRGDFLDLIPAGSNSENPLT